MEQRSLRNGFSSRRELRESQSREFRGGDPLVNMNKSLYFSYLAEWTVLGKAAGKRAIDTYPLTRGLQNPPCERRGGFFAFYAGNSGCWGVREALLAVLRRDSRWAPWAQRGRTIATRVRSVWDSGARAQNCRPGGLHGKFLRAGFPFRSKTEHSRESCDYERLERFTWDLFRVTLRHDKGTSERTRGQQDGERVRRRVGGESATPAPSPCRLD